MEAIKIYLALFSFGVIFYVTWLHSKITRLENEVRFLAGFVTTPEE
ncbi:hypothetical protein LCGC14_2662270 [marine sediment metagenome]|uniref:CcmD family protein n=1 Tax=marine sediment metagenome TaxID=412755 RepID=A0A0F9CIJ2_9ZZZZ